MYLAKTKANSMLLFPPLANLSQDWKSISISAKKIKTCPAAYRFPRVIKRKRYESDRQSTQDYRKNIMQNYRLLVKGGIWEKMLVLTEEK
jgi:hypothetical protein